MKSIEHLKSLTLDLPPSCIEFWPNDEEYAVVGTYNLETQQPDPGEPQPVSQRRNGSLLLLHVENETVNIVQTLSTPSAILDAHFGPVNILSHVLGVATSTGSIGIYRLNRDESRDGFSTRIHPMMKHVKTIQYFSEDVLVTAFSWHPKGWSIGMTLSSGQVCLGKVDVHESEDSTSSVDVTNHNLEAWTLAFTSDGSGLYSGGDDSALQFGEVAINREYHQDFEIEPHHGPIRRASWIDKKIHGAGVTAILPLWSEDEVSMVLTGSYDDHIRLIQIPVVGRRSVVAELNLGGGVWRLKRLDAPITVAEAPRTDAREVLLLASCMHAGARILKLHQEEDDQWRFEVLAKFEEHKSMNYGSDCQSSLNTKGQWTFITTSFYDRLLCLWRY